MLGNYLLRGTFLLHANMLKITTSWDDGDILDIRLANLLSKYGIKGTFYITKNYRPSRLTESDIREISKIHEIGAHTLSHPDLRSLTPEKLHEEIFGSKQWLEGVLNYEVPLFCYPKGFYNDTAVAVVKKAGFVGARTTELGSITSITDPFRIPTSIQVYPFPFRKINAIHFYWRKLLEPFVQRSSALRTIGVSFFSMTSWLTVAKAAFDVAQKNGDIFHLWGHSWEIEKYNMWNDLEKFLEYAAQSKDYESVTNGEMIQAEKL